MDKLREAKKLPKRPKVQLRNQRKPKQNYSEPKQNQTFFVVD